MKVIKMKVITLKYSVGLFLSLFLYTEALIVPQELPSLLSLVYSNIPPVKKGTDSRVGFGFRLGNHADFQVMYELGPQTNTRPIGGSSQAKRNVNQNDYVERSKRNGQSQNIKNENKNQENLQNNEEKLKEATSWLTNWSNHIHANGAGIITDTRSENNQKNLVIQTVPLISESALKQLQKLYHQNPTENDVENGGKQENKLQIFIPESSEALKKEKQQITADLMDVKLD